MNAGMKRGPIKIKKDRAFLNPNKILKCKIRDRMQGKNTRVGAIVLIAVIIRRSREAVAHCDYPPLLS